MTASTAKGTTRPRPNRSPPSGGPARTVAWPRASSCAYADMSRLAGTTARIAASRAGRKNASAAPLVMATAIRCPIVTRSARTTAARVSRATARTPSLQSRIRRRSHRSTHTPAGSETRIPVAMRQAAVSPASAAEPVTARISSGRASPVSEEPSSDVTEPSHRNWNRRLRRRGGGSLMGHLCRCRHRREHRGRESTRRPGQVPAWWTRRRWGPHRHTRHRARHR